MRWRRRGGPTRGPVPTDRPLVVEVNGRRREIPARPDETLLAVLRDRLRLTGTKEACGRGECGACTVLVGAEPVLACVTLAALVRGPVWTVEGLFGEDGTPERAALRGAFADQGAFQCGFCTSGQLVAADWVRRRHPDAGPAEVRALMSGNICRCTGYDPIIAAIRATAPAGEPDDAEPEAGR